MVLKGWEQTRLLRTFDKVFQKQIMLGNIKTPLFNKIEYTYNTYIIHTTQSATRRSMLKYL